MGFVDLAAQEGAGGADVAGVFEGVTTVQAAVEDASQTGLITADQLMFG